MDWLLFLKIAAVSLQLADLGQTCAATRAGAAEVNAANPLLRAHPCAGSALVKGALLLPLALGDRVPRRWQIAAATVSAADGARGVALSVKFYWSRR